MNSFPSSISTSDSIGTSCADKDIALFGLSGNPPTGESGHAGIVRYLVQSGQFHEVWVLPVFRHQFSSKSSLSSFENRVELCQMAFKGYTTESCVVRVLTLERDVEEVVKRHGTVDTLNYIREKCLEARLHLILGADTYNDIAMGKWKQGESLFKLASLHVIERLDMHGPTYLNTKYLSQVCVHEVSWLSDISSASLRVMNPYPFWPLSLPSCLRPTYSLSRTDIILPQVYDYIKRKQLFFYSQTYLRSMIKSRLVLLGMAGFGLLNWLLHDRRRGLK